MSGRVLAIAIAVFAVIILLFSSFGGVYPVGGRNYGMKSWSTGPGYCPGVGQPGVKVPGVDLPKMKN
ncbi:MAG: hypothetical protein ABIJ26_01775 [Candidatus Margulisiibacteriota bacterium]